MAKGKYQTRVTQTDSTWTAEITRKVNVKKVAVSTSKNGFATETEAQAWADDALIAFTEALAEKRQRRTAEKAEETARLAQEQGIADDE